MSMFTCALEAWVHLEPAEKEKKERKNKKRKREKRGGGAGREAAPDIQNSDESIADAHRSWMWLSS
eukprot:1250502-Prymnesium_polylepis.1